MVLLHKSCRSALSPVTVEGGLAREDLARKHASIQGRAHLVNNPPDRHLGTVAVEQHNAVGGGPGWFGGVLPGEARLSVCQLRPGSDSSQQHIRRIALQGIVDIREGRAIRVRSYSVEPNWANKRWRRPSGRRFEPPKPLTGQGVGGPATGLLDGALRVAKRGQTGDQPE